ncbi:MAG: GNAT family N-acetyltransferase [Kordiimonas sp.]
MSKEFLHSSGKFYISTNVEEFDMEQVHRWLSVDAYWSEGIPFELVNRAFRNALSFGIYREDATQIGMARMITDRATFGYLADVFLVPEERGQGLAKWLMDVVMSHPELSGLRRTMLATRDMHPLYKQYGFKNVEGHPLLMEITVPDIYKKTAKS